MVSAGRAAAVAKFGPDHPLAASWGYDFALFLIAKGRPVEADQVLGHVLAGREKTLGPSHRATVATLELMSDLKEQLGQSAEAEALARKGPRPDG